jgi:hypothetical protein
MKPKEKAEELWGKYFQLNYDWDGVTKDQWAKEGALIVIDEMINVCYWNTTKEYLLEVKQEINNL